MLREIHGWFVDNLRDSTSIRTQPVTNDSRNQIQVAPLQDFIFEVFADATPGQEPILLCSRASLHPKWTVEPSEESQTHLFICRCAHGQEPDMQSHGARHAVSWSQTCSLM